MSHAYRLRQQVLFHKLALPSHRQRIRLASNEELVPTTGGSAFLIAASAVVGLGVWAAALSVIF